MLKAELWSKMFQLDPAWRDIEDILTSDFFGVLDYLPRRPFLTSFVSLVASLNPNVKTPVLKDVDWDRSRIRFWPHLHGHEEIAEPDVVIATDKWIMVIEVKLESGLGNRQPWREYMVGKKIAEGHGVPGDCVYYLILARTRPDIAPFFRPTESEKLHELRLRTLYMKWHEAVALVGSWLAKGCHEQPLSLEQARLLQDLQTALRKRRSIAFSGYAFANARSVGTVATSFFCPPLFVDFLGQTPTTTPAAGAVFLAAGFEGFAEGGPEVAPTIGSVFCPPDFRGFLKGVPICTGHNKSFLGVTAHEIDRRA